MTALPGRALHISDLHRGGHAAPAAVDDALVELCEELRPDVVVATGDLANRGRLAELAAARALLDRLPCPTVAVPGNHDLPYSLPARFAAPGRRFEAVVGPREGVLHAASFSLCALDSSWPWRHQGGRLRRASLRRLAELREAAPDALRIAALHHHVAGAPWRAGRKLPLRARDAALAAFSTAGVELVLGGHIHQGAVCERRELQAGAAAAPTLVLSTAPGFGRPRPHRLGEAQGLHVLSWDAASLTVETRIWDGVAFAPSARRTFARGTLAP